MKKSFFKIKSLQVDASTCRLIYKSTDLQIYWSTFISETLLNQPLKRVDQSTNLQIYK